MCPLNTWGKVSPAAQTCVCNAVCLSDDSAGLSDFNGADAEMNQ